MVHVDPRVIFQRRSSSLASVRMFLPPGVNNEVMGHSTTMETTLDFSDPLGSSIRSSCKDSSVVKTHI